MKKIETYIVDSFTDEPFKGNPAGVCILKEELSESEMHSIAKELGLSETAFVIELNKKNEFSIRFFSLFSLLFFPFSKDFSCSLFPFLF